MVFVKTIHRGCMTRMYSMKTVGFLKRLCHGLLKKRDQKLVTPNHFLSLPSHFQGIRHQ